MNRHVGVGGVGDNQRAQPTNPTTKCSKKISLASSHCIVDLHVICKLDMSNMSQEPSMLRLQSNVPLPKTIRPTARGKRRKYPFESMQPGQFFFVPGIQTQQIHGHVWNTGRKLNMRFSTRLCYMREVKGEWQPCDQTEPGATLGVGVWRVE